MQTQNKEGRLAHRFCNKFEKVAFAFILLLLLHPANFAQASATIDHDKIQLQSLNKLTARSSTFEIAIGETIKIGNLYIRAQACRTSPPTERPESAGFIQVWSLTDQTKTESQPDSKLKSESDSEWVFSGWMFASSPGLSSMDHPIYDLWVLSCGNTEADITKTLEELKVVEDNSELPQDGDENIASQIEIIDDNAEEDAPIVIIDGETLIQPTINPTEEDARFQNYDEDESAPILHLE